MSRKDTILIAVVINAGLLAILFTTAIIYDNDKGTDPIELPTPLAESKPVQSEPPQTVVAVAPATGDEVDNVLKYYSTPSLQPIVVETQPVMLTPEPIATLPNSNVEEAPANQVEARPQEQFIEVTVKKGDVLEKIAKANKTTVAAIKKANQLQKENLKIGQVLKIPVKQTSAAANMPADKKPAATDEEKVSSTNAGGESEAVYHVVKSGDSPWKIAKQYHVKYEDILRLNQLDEEKARNLKIGDRIRVK